MKTKMIQEFTAKDIALLQTVLPDNPCNECSAHSDGSCCGCPKGNEYSANVAEYKNENIYDIALSIKRALYIRNNIKEQYGELLRIHESKTS